MSRALAWVDEYVKVYKTNQIMWLFGAGMSHKNSDFEGLQCISFIHEYK